MAFYQGIRIKQPLRPALPIHGNDPQRLIPLGSCVLVQWHDSYCETLFLDGTRVKALAQPESLPQQAEAERCGYVGPGAVERLCFEHEALHTLLARFRDLSVSPVLWDVAHDVDPYTDPARLAQHHTEESEVLALQRYLNTGDHDDDPRGRLSALAYEFDLEIFRVTALALLRPATYGEQDRLRRTLQEIVACGPGANPAYTYALAHSTLNG